MVAKHPPTFDCERCARSYKQSFALEDHYRGSPVHPNCGHCGKGFKDHAELEIVGFPFLYTACFIFLLQ